MYLQLFGGVPLLGFHWFRVCCNVVWVGAGRLNPSQEARLLEEIPASAEILPLDLPPAVLPHLAV